MSITKTDYVLKILDGDVDQGVFSHASEALVRQKAHNLVLEHLEHGRTVPPYKLVRRELVYKTRKTANGDEVPIADGSTCTETELELGL